MGRREGGGLGEVDRAVRGRAAEASAAGALAQVFRDAPELEGTFWVERFVGFCLGSFELFRNPVAHKKVEYTPADAFAALSAAHWIARVLDTAPHDTTGTRAN